MKNTKIIQIDKNIFKNNSTKHQFLKKKIANNSEINNITIIRIDDDLYAGEVKDGKPHGYGRLKYFYEGKAESSYIGEFKEGNRDGVGKWTMFDGTSFYEGEWKLDKMHGKGTYKYLDEVKQGYWFMGRFKRYLDEAMEPCNYIEIIK